MSETTIIKLKKKTSSTKAGKVYSKLDQIPAELFFQILMENPLDLSLLIKEENHEESKESLQKIWDDLINEYEEIIKEKTITGSMDSIIEESEDIRRIVHLEACLCVITDRSPFTDEALEMVKDEGINMTGFNDESVRLLKNTIIQEKTAIEIRHVRGSKNQSAPFDFVITLGRLSLIFKQQLPRDISAKLFAVYLIDSRKKNG